MSWPPQRHSNNHVFPPRIVWKPGPTFCCTMCATCVMLVHTEQAWGNKIDNISRLESRWHCLCFQWHTHTQTHFTRHSQDLSQDQHCPPVESLKNISLNYIKSGIEFKAGHGLFDQFLMRTALLNQVEETLLFHPQSLRHNICHINNDHPIPQALNILQASTALPNGNTTLATVSLFLFKAS